MRHTIILAEFQVMLKMEGMIQTQWPLISTWRFTRPEDDKDQLTLTDVTWQAVILDILMQGEATVYL